MKHGVVKIVDFGVACHLNNATAIQKSKQAGKVRYMAPEMLSLKNYNSQKIDIYSLGCILYFLMTGKET